MSLVEKGSGWSCYHSPPMMNQWQCFRVAAQCKKMRDAAESLFRKEGASDEDIAGALTNCEAITPFVWTGASAPDAKPEAHFYKEKDPCLSDASMAKMADPKSSGCAAVP